MPSLDDLIDWDRYHVLNEPGLPGLSSHVGGSTLDDSHVSHMNPESGPDVHQDQRVDMARLVTPEIKRRCRRTGRVELGGGWALVREKSGYCRLKRQFAIRPKGPSHLRRTRR